MATQLTDAQVDDLLKTLASGSVDKAQFRSVMQGLSFGFADEIEAGARSMFSETYDEAIGKVRGKLKDYKEAFPIESTAYEVGGAMIPAVAATVLTGGLAAPAAGAGLLRTGGRLALIGGGEGAVTALGTSEGDVSERIKNVPLGFAGGAVMGPLGAAGVKAGGVAINKLIDTARRISGGRGATVVENELLRLADSTGLSADEIIARIASGETMSDNKTLHMSVRALMAQGGQPEKVIRQTLPERAAAKRAEALSGVKSGLSKTNDDNVLRATRMDEAEWKAYERDGYKTVFSGSDEITQELSDSALSAVQRLPNAMEDVSSIYQARNLVPLFKKADDGSIQYARAATLEDTEIIRRSIAEAKGKAYRAGSGGLGEALDSVESGLRSSIDKFSPNLKGVRAGYSRMMDARNAFEDGRKAFNKPPEELEIIFNELTKTGDNAIIQAFREGAMAQINNKMARSGSKQLMGKMSDPNTLEGKLFATIFPADQQASVLNKLDLAGKTQATMEQVTQGSTTALAQQAVKQQNKGISLGEIAGAGTGQLTDIASVGFKLVQSMAPQLTESQRGRIVEVLLSESPDLVKKALTDESAMMALQQRVAQIMQGASAAAQGASAYYGGQQGAEATKGLLAQ